MTVGGAKFVKAVQNVAVIETHEHTGEFKEP
jgi:hypothetical protein